MLKLNRKKIPESIGLHLNRERLDGHLFRKIPKAFAIKLSRRCNKKSLGSTIIVI